MLIVGCMDMPTFKQSRNHECMSLSRFWKHWSLCRCARVKSRQNSSTLIEQIYVFHRGSFIHCWFLPLTCTHCILLSFGDVRTAVSSQCVRVYLLISTDKDFHRVSNAVIQPQNRQHKWMSRQSGWCVWQGCTNLKDRQDEMGHAFINRTIKGWFIR